MNERIRKLATRADAYADTFCMSTETLPDGQTWTTLRDEKFAELIVRECVRLLEEDDGATHHEELLLEHFGVE